MIGGPAVAPSSSSRRARSPAELAARTRRPTPSQHEGQRPPRTSAESRRMAWQRRRSWQRARRTPRGEQLGVPRTRIVPHPARGFGSLTLADPPVASALASTTRSSSPPAASSTTARRRPTGDRGRPSPSRRHASSTSCLGARAAGGHSPDSSVRTRIAPHSGQVSTASSGAWRIAWRSVPASTMLHASHVLRRRSPAPGPRREIFS